jgi:hypothetical protein
MFWLFVTASGGRLCVARGIARIAPWEGNFQHVAVVLVLAANGLSDDALAVDARR